MATTTHDPYTDTPHAYERGRTEIRRAERNDMSWLWPLLALAALGFLGWLFYRGMQRPTNRVDRPAVTAPARTTSPSTAPVR